VETRPADRSDYHGARAVQVAVLPQDHRYDYADNLGRSGSTNFVATENDSVVGFMSVLLIRSNPYGEHLWQRVSPYVAFIGVLPQFQGRKVGSALFREGSIAAFSLSDGAKLWVEPYEQSRGFYETLGCVCASPESVRQETGLTPKGLVYCLRRDLTS
jgi:GNAT superfamily N-acetyltransferase